MIKLVATDIDGTVLIPEGKFTEGVKKCIKRLKEQNIKVVLVTGRMNAAATLIAKELDLDTPVISYQGGLINNNGEILYERYLTENQSEKILAWAELEKIHINLYNNDVLYSQTDCFEIQRYCNNQHTNYKIEDFSKIKKNKVT